MHMRFPEKEKQLPADILLDPDGHKKGSKWDCGTIYYSRVCARERRDEGKIATSLSSSFSKLRLGLFPYRRKQQALALLTFCTR